MFCSYQGHIGAYLVLGGVDTTGPHLFTVHAHGSTDKLPYVSMGEGGGRDGSREERREASVSCFSSIKVLVHWLQWQCLKMDSDLIWR